MRFFQTITVVPKQLDLNHEQTVNEIALKEYLKGIDENSVVSFDNWLVGKSYDKSEIFMWRTAK